MAGGRELVGRVVRQGLWLERRELVGQVIQAERAERQRGHVPGLQVELAAAGGVCGSGLVPAGQPGTLAELVADRLAWAAQVPNDLAGQELGVPAAVRGEEL